MTRSTRIILSLAALVLAGVLVLGWMWGESVRSRTVMTDADTIRVPADGAPTRSILWQPPAPLAANTPAEEYEPRLSADGQTLLFVRGKAGSNADIYACERTPDGWSEPAPLASINTDKDELGPELSADGQSLYFYSNRDGGVGGYDLWVSRGDGDGWGQPRNLGPAINSAFNEYSPSLTPDGGLLYFASNRPRPGEPPATEPTTWPATIRERLVKHDYDLYSAPIKNNELGPAEALLALNTPANEGTPAVSPVGDFLYFSSDRRGGEGGLDLYRARRLRGHLESPTNLGPPVNSPHDDVDPALSMGGFALHFSSNRPAEPAAEPSTPEASDGPAPEPPATLAAGTFDLYQTTSREVFQEVEARRPIDWAGTWAMVWPYLVWLLLLLLALLLLLRLIKELRERKLGILSKCLLASLLAHILLMFLLDLWGVSSAIGELLNRSGGTKVHLTEAPAGEDSLAVQVRGQLTDASITVPEQEPAMTMPSLAAPESIIEPAQLAAAATRLTVEAPVHITSPSEAQPRETEAPTPRPVADATPVTPDVPLPAAAAPTAAAEAAAAAPQPSARPEPLRPELARQDVQVAIPESQLAPAAPAAEATLTTPTPNREANPETPSAPSTAAAMPESASPRELDIQIPADSSRQAATESQATIAAAAPAAQPAPSATALPTARPATVEIAAAPSRPVPGERLAASAAREADAAPTTQQPAHGALPLPESAEPAARAVAVPSETAAGRPDALAEKQTAVEVQQSSPGLVPALPRETAATRSAISAPAPAPSKPDGRPILEAAASGREAAPAPSAVPDQPTGLIAPELAAADLRLPTESAAPKAAESKERETAIAAAPARTGLMPALPGTTQKPVAASPGPAPDRSKPDALPLLDSLATAGRDSAPNLKPETPSDRTGLIPPETLATDLKLPTETAPPVDQYAQRAPEQRQQILERLGGSPDTEKAVALALKWLAAHQSEDGRWSGEDFDDGCDECGGEATAESDAAQTGLALLCFLGADHTHLKDGPYRETVAKGIRWLLKQQTADGDLRHEETMYSHGIAAIALSEAYGITKDPELKEPVAAAIRFIVAARNSRSGGWRYDPGQAGDTSVLGWQVMALTSARRAGLEVPEEALDSAREWLDKVSAGSPGLYAYQPRQAPTVSMTAEGLFSQQLLGRGRDEPRMRASVELILESLPRWSGTRPGATRQINTYYWYYATLALFQHQGPEWQRWNEALTKALLANQRTEGKAAGSWDPADRWSRTGGRIYQTAMCTLSLEVYYRYLPMYAAAPKE